MKKERILIQDSKGLFLKMFKRNFKDEFDFFENSFLYKNNNEVREFDHSIFVIYDKYELIRFLKLDKDEVNVLVCLFNKQLYDNLYFLYEIKNFILLDSSKRRTEIIQELKLNFKNKFGTSTQVSKNNFKTFNISPLQFNDIYKFLFFLT